MDGLCAGVEQAAFAPSNVAPGVEFSPDKMLQGRIFAYADTHRYRIATNYAHLPINRPLSQADNETDLAPLSAPNRL